MKRLVFLLSIVLFAFTAMAQRGHGRGEIKWLSLSLKGGYGGSLFLNSDVLNDDHVSVNYLSPHYTYGSRFGITYGNNIGINIEPMFSHFNQEYSISNGSHSYIKNQKFKSFDLFVSLRYITDFAFYLEAGPQFSTLKSASVNNNISGGFTEDLSGNYIDNFLQKNTSIAFGLGLAAINGDRVQLFLGLRANYGLGNFVDNPAYYVLRDGVYNPNYTPSAKTNPITYKLMVELNYFFGFWGDASCGRGRLMFFQ
jgi:hypothetical protein